MGAFEVARALVAVDNGGVSVDAEVDADLRDGLDQARIDGFVEQAYVLTPKGAARLSQYQAMFAPAEDDD